MNLFAKKENAETYIKTYKNYKTADGEQIIEGQTFYVYEDKNFKCVESRFGNFLNGKWAEKRFKTEEEVKELILMNKPCLSLNDLLANWGEISCRPFHLKSPLFQSFKNFAKTKI